MKRYVLVPMVCVLALLATALVAFSPNTDSVINGLWTFLQKVTIDAQTGDTALQVKRGCTRLGTGSTADVTCGDDDAFIEGTLEVDGATRLDGAVSAGSTLSVAGASSLGGDVTLSDDSTGGNAGARVELQALPKLTLKPLGSMTNGSTETTSYLDDTPTGEWSEIDAGTNVAVSADTAVYRVGTTSLELALAATAVAGDGVGRTVVSDDLTDNESIGFWLYSTAPLTAGDLEIQLDDDDAATDPTANVPAVATANQWTWVEVDISGCDGGGTDCDAVTAVNVLLTTAGASNLGATTVYMDAMYKWDAADEESLGVNLIQDGVLKVLRVFTAAGSANTITDMDEHTDYFTHYQSGVDAIVTMTDQSARSGLAFVAYQ